MKAGVVVYDPKRKPSALSKRNQANGIKKQVETYNDLDKKFTQKITQ